MGEVYRIEHVRMGKVAAMKMIHGVMAKNQEMRARFQREAQAVSRLTQIHTVQVFDFGQHKEAMYLVMEYVRGEDLGSVLRRDGPMDVFRAGDVVVQVCGALAEAHDQGVIHRDIKPENLLLTRTKDGHDFVKVVDFGLARIREEGEPSITAQGSVIGTPYYMSPEQARGEEPDQRTDIYALGGVLYRALTGEVPYAAPSPMVVLTKCLTEELKPPRVRRPDLEIPHKAQDVVMKAMAKSPDDRYHTAEEMAKDMQSCLESLSQPRFVSPVGGLAVSFEEEGKRASDSPETWSTSLRLSRRDFDHYENALRRRRMLQKLLIPLTLLILAGGLTVFFWPTGSAGSKPATTEKEPNNTTDKANPVANGLVVKGTVGKRLSDTESDLDIYSFQIPSGVWRLRGDLWPQRNMDLVLRVYGEDGPTAKPLVVAQHSGETGAEAFTSQAVKGGRTFFAVVSEMVGPKGPKEGVSDQYRLKISWEPLKENHEQEPNDSVETSQQFPNGGHLSGFVNDNSDRDYYLLETAKLPRGTLLTVNLEAKRGADRLLLDCVSKGEPRAQAKAQGPVEQVRRMKVVAAMKRACQVPLEKGTEVVVVKVSHKSSAHIELPSPSSPEDMVLPYRLVAKVE